MEAKKTTKVDLVNALYEKTGMNRREIGRFVDLFVLELKNALASRSLIELRGFGTFEVKQRKARSGVRNPKTGEPVTLAAHGVVSFKPGQDLKQSAWTAFNDEPKDNTPL
jgi:integration host factor subunit beta